MLLIFTFDFSPIETPLSPQLFKSSLISSYLPAEKSAQSLFAFDIFKLLIFNSEKSASRASLNEFWTKIVLIFPDVLIKFIASSQLELFAVKSILSK